MVVRTLVEQGFALPKTPPKSGHKRLDALGRWNYHALKIVIAEFLQPGCTTTRRSLRDNDVIDRVIAHAARRDGYQGSPRGGKTELWPHPVLNDLYNYSQSVHARYAVACWIGLPGHVIWPHLGHIHDVAHAERACETPVSTFAASTIPSLPPPAVIVPLAPWPAWKQATRVLLRSIWRRLA